MEGRDAMNLWVGRLECPTGGTTQRSLSMLILRQAGYGHPHFAFDLLGTYHLEAPPTANESQPTGLGGTGMLGHTCTGHT